MMTKLLSYIRMAEAMEINEARKNHELLFHSMHEGYGVLAEETGEGVEESDRVQRLQERLLYAIRVDDPVEMADCLENLENHALLAACEYVQAAAMAKKCAKTLRALAKEEKKRMAQEKRKE